MDKSDLHSFREEWKREINKKQQSWRREKNEIGATLQPHASDEGAKSISVPNISENTILKISPETLHCPCDENKSQKIPFVSKKQKLNSLPLLTLDIPSYQIKETDNGHPRMEKFPHLLSVPGNKCCDNQDLISLLIRDIDETTLVPFFDISLPKEVCVKIFSHLDVKELCRCACVSKTWSSLANDELIWHHMYKKLGFKQHGKTAGEQTGWKGLVRDCILKEQSMMRNWKERICQIQALEYEKGGALSACQIHKDLLVAGYANGKTCLWNVDNNWKHSLDPTPEIFEDPAKASVECVSLLAHICATAFTCGVVNVWHTDISSSPIYQYRLTKPAHHLVLASSETPLLLTCSGSEMRLDKVQDDGQWGLVNTKSFDSQITFATLLPGDRETTFVIAVKEEIVMYRPRIDGLSSLDKIAGTKITAVTSSSEHIAVGWAPFGFGTGTDFTAKVRLYDTKIGRQLESFVGHYGDITCVNLSFKNGLVTGSKDKKVRVYDIRTEQPQQTLRGHTSLITTAQMDSWKVVSGAFDGTLKVWDLRMGTVLWETLIAHPIRLCQFDSNRLVTANIPLDKIPRETMWYADDLILHRRHRGSVHVYDFSATCEPGVVPEEMRSNYDDIAGYNYNINLVAPYDTLTSEIN